MNPTDLPSLEPAAMPNVDDTVAVADRKGYGVVDEVYPSGRVVVTHTWTTRDGDIRTTTATYRANDVTLVRRGNRDADVERHLRDGRDLHTALTLADRTHRAALRAYRARASV